MGCAMVQNSSVGKIGNGKHWNHFVQATADFPGCLNICIEHVECRPLCLLGASQCSIIDLFDFAFRQPIPVYFWYYIFTFPTHGILICRSCRGLQFACWIFAMGTWTLARSFCHWTLIEHTVYAVTRIPPSRQNFIHVVSMWPLISPYGWNVFCGNLVLINRLNV